MSKNIEKQYLKLLKDILDNGVEKQDRTGTGTISVFGRQIRHKMSEGFPLLTTKKMYWKGIVTELLWFLRGDTNIKYLVDNDCHIWDGDCYQAYCKIAGSIEEPDYDIHIDDPNQNCTRLMTKDEFINRIKIDDKFAKTWGDLGPVYGKQWRRWTKYDNQLIDKDLFPNVKSSIDQISNLIQQLKANPDSRRLMVSAWNVGELDQMTLPPCHYGFQVYTRDLTIKDKLNYVRNKWPRVVNEDGWNNLYVDSGDAEEWLMTFGINEIIPQRAISLMWNQRSVDTFLGLPFNIASYALLLEIIAKEVNMVPDELIGNLGDVHLYSNHIEQANEQITREPMELPDVRLRNYENLTSLLNTKYSKTKMIQLWHYDSHPTIKAPLSN